MPHDFYGTGIFALKLSKPKIETVVVEKEVYNQMKILY
jgi:hypothetical protein